MRAIKKVSFLGLGVMGAPMAAHIAAKTECDITVYNRTPSKATAWVEQAGKGTVARTPAAAASGADLVLLCVGNDDDLRSILTAPDGVIFGIKPGTIIVDHTTVSAKAACDMAGIFAREDVYFMDAPVSGGQAGAINGTLTVMAGGTPELFEHVAPILRAAYAREMRLMGAVGAGQITKMVNQICIAGTLQGLSEALSFGMKAGLDMDEVLAVISKGAAQSWQMDNRGKTMVADQFDFGFALDWMIKDLRIVMDEAERSGVPLQITPQILGFYEELKSQGHGRCDTSALIKRLTKND
ncbi:MAG: NAD(P)-dependent oxidoreductase [Alphaproteobacteria bacterium]|nr:NAD(P)-dependent oxidoreductase [Alphaproteobacteria bacterium]MBU0859128.1 NAD(P)-dependent oxidoreductase [Alphaproteobacteria bacterium]